jgi:uncharacterized membrane-anchored protein
MILLGMAQALVAKQDNTWSGLGKVCRGWKARQEDFEGRLGKKFVFSDLSETKE